MNRPPETFVQVQEERLLAFAVACFQKAGLDNTTPPPSAACWSILTCAGCVATARGR